MVEGHVRKTQQVQGAGGGGAGTHDDTAAGAGDGVLNERKRDNK